MKGELATVPIIYLPAFLLSILKFIVTERKDNCVGATTVSVWSVQMYRGAIFFLRVRQHQKVLK